MSRIAAHRRAGAFACRAGGAGHRPGAAARDDGLLLVTGATGSGNHHAGGMIGEITGTSRGTF